MERNGGNGYDRRSPADWRKRAGRMRTRQRRGSFDTVRRHRRVQTGFQIASSHHLHDQYERTRIHLEG